MEACLVKHRRGGTDDSVVSEAREVREEEHIDPFIRRPHAIFHAVADVYSAGLK